MDYSPPGSSVYVIFQARILEWVSISFSRESSQFKDRTHVSCVSCINRWILYHWATREAHSLSLFPYSLLRSYSLLDGFYFSYYTVKHIIDHFISAFKIKMNFKKSTTKQIYLKISDNHYVKALSPLVGWEHGSNWTTGLRVQISECACYTETRVWKQ